MVAFCPRNESQSMLPTDEVASGAGTGVLGNFETKLIRISDVSTIATRHSKKTFYCPRYNRETEGGRTFIAKAVKLWNSLPDKLKDCPNVKSFMRAYTSHFAAINADLEHFTVN